MTTIKKIANELSLSTATVSRAISGKGRVSEKTRKLVNDYVGEVGYHPNAIAQGLAKSKSYSIALVIPKDINASLSFFFYESILNICEVCESSGYDIIVVTSNEDSYEGFEHLIRKRKIDGLILTRIYDDDTAVQHLLKSGIPFLVIGESGNPNIMEVCNDYIEASAALTSYLLDSGSKRILFVSGSSKHLIMQNREAGYLQAFESTKNKTIKPYCLLNMKSETDIAMHLPDILHEIIPDALIAADDVICEWSLAVLRNLDYKIPQDIRIASCTDSNIMSQNIPTITAININTSTLSKTAARILIDYLSGKDIKNRTIVPYSIHLRESTKV